MVAKSTKYMNGSDLGRLIAVEVVLQPHHVSIKWVGDKVKADRESLLIQRKHDGDSFCTLFIDPSTLNL